MKRTSHFIESAGRGRRLPQRVIASPAIAQSMPELKWRMTSSFPKSLDTIYGARRECSPRRSPRRPTAISRSRSSRPAKSSRACRPPTRCSNGTVEMCHTASYYYVGKDPTFAFGTAVPFGLNARQQNAWLL